MTAVDNVVDAPDKTVTVSGTVIAAGVTAPAAVALKITDDDAPAWQVTVDPAAIDENGGKATVTVSTGGVTFNDIRTIRLSFAGDATLGSDYQVEDAGGNTLASPYELTLAAGDSAVTATIAAQNDEVDDDTEQIEVTARHDGGGDRGSADGDDQRRRRDAGGHAGAVAG